MFVILKKIFKSLFGGFSMWRRLKTHALLMEALRVRIVFSCVFGVVVFGAVTYRLLDIMIIQNMSIKSSTSLKNDEEQTALKADITDRNGEIIASCVTTASCYADPSVIIDVNEAVEKLSKISNMPSKEMIKFKISNRNKHFVWLARHITPNIQQKIMDMGIPGIFFKKDYKRVYPQGRLFSHVIGYSDIDGDGISGIEKQFNNELKEKALSNRKLNLTLDIGIQSIVYTELEKSIQDFSAIGGNAILMNTDGEILSMVSLLDFDPNNIRKEDVNAMFNRNTLGAYEPGSTFKVLNTAIALESGTATLGTMFDASAPIKIGRFKITDFKGKNRPLSLAEAFVFSSNIASAKVAQNFGIKTQQHYMKKFGILDRCSLELPEVGHPIVPKVWQEATSITMSYGYGVSVSPLQLITAITSIVNNGYKVSPTLVLGKHKKRTDADKIVSDSTSETMRELMRAAVCCKAKKANVEGVEIFGKTGTAYKSSSKNGYGRDGSRSRITTFIGGFPKSNPKYMLVVMLDDPKATKETFGYATGGWNAAAAAGRIFERIVPILNDDSSSFDDPQPELKVAKYIKLD